MLRLARQAAQEVAVLQIPFDDLVQPIASQVERGEEARRTGGDEIAPLRFEAARWRPHAGVALVAERVDRGGLAEGRVEVEPGKAREKAVDVRGRVAGRALGVADRRGVDRK